MKKVITQAVLILLIVSCSYDKTAKNLRQEGTVINRDRVIAYFPKNSLPENRMNEIVDTINLGIALAEKYMGGPYDWQVFKGKQLTYYFCEGNFMSTTSKNGDIFIPVWRAQSNQSPWLHETIHILLRSVNGNWNPKSNPMNLFKMPMWLTEGMAEFIAMKVSYDNQIPKFDIFNSGGFSKLDSICNISLRQEYGPRILKYIGKPGIMIKLFTKKRRFYAPTFYNCSCSFTKYLVKTYGLDKVLNAYAKYKKEIKTIEEFTGKTMDELRKDWLLKISLNSN
ncbi:MAG TPA: hypothetical protein VMT63_11650 [Bacteroidales bacterium]|nr:hypothetical protein [Bacteroidales bacterium]